MEENRGFGAYRHTVEIIVESSALYSVSLILYASVSEGGSESVEYFDAFAAALKVSVKLWNLLH